MKTITAVLLLLVGCTKPTPPPPAKPAPAPLATAQVQPNPEFSIGQPVLSGEPDFKVTFSIPLSQDRELRVTATSRPWLASFDLGDEVDVTDEVRQSDGKWVIFDCANIADRIIDASLAKELRAPCKAGRELAWSYWKQRHYSPDEFVDATGKKWVAAK